MIQVGQRTTVDELGSLDANDVLLPVASAAAVASRNGHPVVAYDDTSDEIGIFPGFMPRDYDPLKTLRVRVFWAGQTAVVGDVKWDVAWERIEPGVTDLDADSFAAAQTVTDTTDGTSGVTTESELTFTQAEADGVTPAEPYRLKVTRDATTDTMVGDAQLLRVSIEQE